MEEKDILEMRQQLALLREKLNDQQIVNDRILRDSMRQKTSDIKHTERFSYVAAVLSLACFPALAYTEIFSIPLCIATCLMMLFCIGATLYIHHPVNRTDLMTADMATVASVMQRFKRQYDFWLHYITPTLLLPWLGWACYEYAERGKLLGIKPLHAILPLLMGVVIGGIIGYRKHCKAVNAAENILEQIES